MRKGLRKLAAVVLTAAMAMTVGMPAFAADTNEITKESLISLAEKYNLEIKFTEKTVDNSAVDANSMEDVEKALQSALSTKRAPIVTVNEYIVDEKTGILIPINGDVELMDYEVNSPVSMQREHNPVSGLHCVASITANYGIYSGGTQSGRYWVKVTASDFQQKSTTGMNTLGYVKNPINTTISADKSKITQSVEAVIYNYLTISIPGSNQAGLIKTGEQDYTANSYFYAKDI